MLLQELKQRHRTQEPTEMSADGVEIDDDEEEEDEDEVDSWRLDGVGDDVRADQCATLVKEFMSDHVPLELRSSHTGEAALQSVHAVAAGVPSSSRL